MPDTPLTPRLDAYQRGFDAGMRGLVPDFLGMSADMRAAYLEGFDDARAKKGIPRNRKAEP